jgi:hypothetical protein
LHASTLEVIIDFDAGRRDADGWRRDERRWSTPTWTSAPCCGGADADAGARADLTIVAANAAYLAVAMATRAQLIGRPLFEVYPTPRRPDGRWPPQPSACCTRC